MAALGLGLGVLVPGSAGAVDGLRIRTPVLWSDGVCMTIVDRSVDPVVHLPYDIPFEDTEVTEDEVADGRTHQFFGLCRSHDPTDDLPTWISEADVAAAEALELIDLGTIVGDAILDLNGEWQGCALRITGDDQRRPITFAAAGEGIDWDTSGVDAGAWVVEGFTHDPALSIWSARPGVFKVVDDPALEASGPAAAVLNGEEVVFSGEVVTIDGCVSAMDGSVLELWWAEVGDETWQPALRGEPVRGEGFGLELLLPPEMAGQAARVRVEVEDPMGRRTIAYMGELVLVLPTPPGPCEGDECGSTGDPGSVDSSGGAMDTSGGGAMSTGAIGGSGGTDAGSGSTPGADEPVGAVDGCGCIQPGPAPRGLGWAWLSLVVLLRPRGRGSYERT